MRLEMLRNSETMLDPASDLARGEEEVSGVPSAKTCDELTVARPDGNRTSSLSGFIMVRREFNSCGTSSQSKARNSGDVSYS